MNEEKKEKKTFEKVKDKLGKKPQLPKNTFNFYWLYALVAVVFVANMILNFNQSVKEINQQEFFVKMLSQNDVDRVVIVNREIAEVYIKPSSLSKEQYKDVNKKSVGSSSPQYYITLGSLDAFDRKLSEMQKDIPSQDQILPVYETRKNWTGDILRWILPIV
ncbi:MAG: ATP-dependent metallopeptidase FtsH/Yme1/Tma family protein, partial [Bacteroidia bacterium]|nr:ATP-dependent metallopeptidase FtsH/Yme1/Tma family protein [Bacteroidia bacterium]